ncbi:MAG: adenylate kinase [Planctomycetota bacterium]
MTLSRLVFLGPPGAGKGTHAVGLAKDRDLRHLSTGDMLRAAVKAGTPTGRQAGGYMEAGKLVPDELIIDLLFEAMADAGAGWILDGFPRTLPQAEALDARLAANEMPLDRVIQFDVADEVLVDRISARLSCPGCGAVYNAHHKPPEVEGVCDVCGTALVTRADDRPEAVRERLAVYAAQTAPLIDYYEGQGLLTRVDADRDIGAIRADLDRLIGAG